MVDAGGGAGFLFSKVVELVTTELVVFGVVGEIGLNPFVRGLESVWVDGVVVFIGLTITTFFGPTIDDGVVVLVLLEVGVIMLLDVRGTWDFSTGLWNDGNDFWTVNGDGGFCPILLLEVLASTVDGSNGWIVRGEGGFGRLPLLWVCGFGDTDLPGSFLTINGGGGGGSGGKNVFKFSLLIDFFNGFIGIGDEFGWITPFTNVIDEWSLAVQVLVVVVVVEEFDGIDNGGGIVWLNCRLIEDVDGDIALDKGGGGGGKYSDEIAVDLGETGFMIGGGGTNGGGGSSGGGNSLLLEFDFVSLEIGSKCCCCCCLFSDWSSWT